MVQHQTVTKSGRGCSAAVLLPLGQDSDRIELYKISGNLVASVEAEVLQSHWHSNLLSITLTPRHTVKQKNISSSAQIVSQP